jgi:hypothetical protein
MPNQERHSSIATFDTGRISIHINESQSPIDLPSSFGENPQGEKPLPVPVSRRLFEYAEDSYTPFPERFPRLTFLAIAVALLASTLTAEFECLRGAGYYWP